MLGFVFVLLHIGLQLNFVHASKTKTKFHAYKKALERNFDFYFQLVSNILDFIITNIAVT